MRVYFTTMVPTVEAIFHNGFSDLYEQFGRHGVYFSTVQLCVLDGYDGNVTLCLEVPDDVMAEYDVTDALQERSGYRLALIPAAVLNRLGRPQVYDHVYAGCSRSEVLRVIRAREQDDSPASQARAAEMRQAMAFFDRIGWLTPLCLSEESRQ
jgi:hypothetical protein